MWARMFVMMVGRVTIGTVAALLAGTAGVYAAWWLVNRGPQMAGYLSQFAG
jgi:hypothetical protein